MDRSSISSFLLGEYSRVFYISLELYLTALETHQFYGHWTLDPPLLDPVSTSQCQDSREFLCTLDGLPFSHGFIVYSDSRRLQNIKIAGKSWTWKDGLAGIRGNRCQKNSPFPLLISGFFAQRYLKRLSSIMPRKLATLNRPTNETIPRNKYQLPIINWSSVTRKKKKMEE